MLKNETYQYHSKHYLILLLMLNYRVVDLVLSPAMILTTLLISHNNSIYQMLIHDTASLIMSTGTLLIIDRLMYFILILSLRFGPNTTFVILDTNAVVRMDGEQKGWLEAQLAVPR